MRAEISPWLKLQETQSFTSKSTCTVAVFGLEDSEIATGNGLTQVFSTRQGIKAIGAGQTVLFGMPGMSPTLVSEALMTKNLPQGLGLLSSGVGPVLSCVKGDELKGAIYGTLVSPAARLIYIPAGNAIILIYPPENVAIFLRGNV